MSRKINNTLNSTNDCKKSKADTTELSGGKFLKHDFEQQIEAAIKKINELKANKAPQDEVMAAIKAFETFVQLEYHRDNTLLFALKQQSALAAQRIRELKWALQLQLQLQSHDELMVAINKYISLCESIDIIQSIP